MIGEILNAVLGECSALLSGTGASVILKTNFKSTKNITNQPSFILLDLTDAPESVIYPGGLTRMDWVFSFNSYSYEPDAYVDETDTGYSTNLLNFIDLIRQHFSVLPAGEWLTSGMNDVANTYGFQYTLSGIAPADGIDEDGLIMGYKITFNSTSFDQVTYYTPATEPLQNIQQINNPPF
jgi:hypothetical protein